ncbi:MAG TPA: S-layer homology domain-containing protein [Bacillota bacterium]|nr:S-layer homology domain-containing protein [Bacillota bacterium]
MNKSKNRFRKLVYLIVTVLFIGGSLIPAYCQEEPGKMPSFSGGAGTPEDPYLISTAEDLLAFSEVGWNASYMEASYKLTGNIDLGENAWNPVGVNGPPFSGTFDGNGKTITLRNIADSRNMGLFGGTDRRSSIKNLKVSGQISKTITSEEEACFGLIAAWAEGSIENCITEGSVDLSVNGPRNFYFGGAAGRLLGRIDSMINKADLTIKISGGDRLIMGGITGDATGKEAGIFNLTNQGNITATFDGIGTIGGLAGFCGFGANAENLLNHGNVTVMQTRAPNSSRSAAGGIVGELRDSGMDKALNKGSIYFEHSGPYANEEVMAGGIAGESEIAWLKNVGNEGNVETKTARIQLAIGITKPGREVTIENAYSRGRIYASTTDDKGELYVMGIGEEVPTNNFYFSGTVRLKIGKKNEEDGDAFANIRPGAKTGIYNYCYWDSKFSPFPAYPFLNKAAATSKAVNTATGKLSSPVSIGGRQYDNISEALNAWVDMQKGGYLKWTKGAEPSFEWTFGYQIPDFMQYKNGREGKWLNTSDWACEWMDKADRLSIIPDILLNQDMARGITRKEFSALAVKLYENLKGSKIAVDLASPFTDTSDSDVIKAYSLGIVSGIGNGLFAPDASLTREQASTMLARVYKAVYWEGWALGEDAAYDRHVLDTAGVAKFSDDELISGYAKDSVYFMVKNNIIAGIGNNMFGPAPKEGQEGSYGRASREQAFKIAVAMIECFNEFR